MKVYCIYSIVPTINGDSKRVVEIFDTEEDAKKVLAVLESVNHNFSLYKIEKVTYE